jgi:pimeloyl-ACP methyl ester carboxylesterase
LGGLAVRYLTAGESPSLVLLHALDENALDWSWMMAALSRDHSLYAPDLPEIGDGGDLVAPSPPVFPSLVAGFLDSLDVGRAAIVGNPYGGLVNLRLALSEPGRL